MEAQEMKGIGDPAQFVCPVLIWASFHAGEEQVDMQRLYA